MDEKMVQQMIGEMVKSTETAMGLLTLALVRQMDPLRLRADLSAILEKEGKDRGPSLATNLCRSALAAVDAEIQLRQVEKSARH